MSPLSLGPWCFPRNCLVGGALLCALVTGTSPASGESESPVPDGELDEPSAVTPPGSETTISPPRLQVFEEAEYPAEARSLGLDGEVVLELQIDREGAVTSSRVVEPAGHGFDEAARAASLKFRFVPARRGVETVGARIRYRYTFQLEAMPDERPPQTAHRAPTASRSPLRIRGRVVIRVPGEGPAAQAQPASATEGVGVAGAHVVVTLPDGSTRELWTDPNGEYTVGQAPAGPCHIHVEAAGFSPVDADLLTRESGPIRSVMTLEPATSNAPEALEVTVRDDLPSGVTQHRLTQRELATAPGSLGDAVRALQNLPGVVPLPLGSSQLIVRGTAPTDTLFYIDGLMVLDVYHLWGLSSVVPTEMLERLDYYPGNYGVKYGRGMGGMIELGVRDPNPDGRYHGLAQLDVVDARILLEGPVPGAKKWSFIGGVRRSHLDAVAMPVLGWDLSPAYYDYQFFVIHRPSPRSRLRVGFMGADDAFRFSDDGGVVRTDYDIANGFLYFTSSYENHFAKNATWSHTLAFGRIYQRFELSSNERNYTAESPIHPLAARTELGWQMLPWASVKLGTDLQYAPFRVKLQVPSQGATSNQPDARSAYDPLVKLETTDVYLRPGAYAEMTVTPVERLRATAGLRADYARDTSQLDLSPRLALRYDLVRSPHRTTVKGGVGLFYQPPLTEQSLVGYGNKGLHSSRAVQTSLGLEREFGADVEGSVEGFYYDLHDLVERRPDSQGNLQNVNSGEGYTLGLESLLRIKPTSRFYGWVAYTLSRSMRRGAPGEELVLYEYDTTHILTGLASYRLGRGWELGGKWQYISGRPYTPRVGALYSSSENSYIPILGATNSARYPAYHELDLRAQKRWEIGPSGSITAYLDLINVYGNDRVTGIRCNFDYTRCSYDKFPIPLIPSLGIRGEF